MEVPSHLDAVIEAGGTLVTPTRQRAHAVRLAHAARQLARGRRVWSSLDVLPLEGWLTRELERHAIRDGAGEVAPRLLRPVEEWLLWRDGAAAAAGHLALINGGALAEGLLGASRLAGELGIDLTRVRAAPDTETSMLLEVHRAVGERTRALGASALQQALQRIGAPGDARPVLLCGFLMPSPRLRALRAAREARGWQTRWCAPQEPMSQPQVVCAADDTEELDRIASWCRETLRHRPDGRLLVVLPGSVARCERLAALIRQALDASAAFDGGEASVAAVEGGAPLARQPAVAQALATLALLSGESMPLETLLEWLRSPFWREPAEARAGLDLWMRERAPPALDRRTLARLLASAPGGAAGSIVARIAEAAESLAPANGSPREWSERFQAALEALGWPGPTGLDSPAQQTLIRLRELLDEYGQLSGAVSRFARAAALDRLRELAARTAYRPADEDTAVTVTPALADPVVRYEGIWVAGLSEDTLPQAPAPDSFLPLAAQLKAGWPAASPAGRLEQARALLASWQAATDQLVLSTPQRVEDVTLLPSPLLAPWRTTGTSRFAPLPWLPERVHRPEQRTPWQEATVPWDLTQTLPGGTRTLELQNACPFRAYAELRLGCVALGVSEPGVAGDLRGRLLHAALQALWHELGDSSALAALTPTELDVRIEACVERSAATVLTGQGARPSAPVLERERRRSLRLIRALCALEGERPPFTVRHTEHDVSLALAGTKLRMRMDRVDVLEHGAVVILDYKSGRPVRADWYGERPSHPQLLAYQAAFGDAVRALATVHLSAREIGFQGIAAREGLLPGAETAKTDGAGADPWTECVTRWHALLEGLASAFGQGLAAVDPKPGACDYCHLKALCRIDERPELAAAFDAGDGP